MSLRIGQNWEWSNKIFSHTLYVVSTFDKTIQCGICLTSNKTLFLLALRFRSKLKQDVNISLFVDHSMLKNQRALNTFLHANQMKMYT